MTVIDTQEEKMKMSCLTKGTKWLHYMLSFLCCEGLVKKEVYADWRGKMRDREGKKEYTVGASKGKKKKLKEETSRKQHSN